MDEDEQDDHDDAEDEEEDDPDGLAKGRSARALTCRVRVGGHCCELQVFRILRGVVGRGVGRRAPVADMHAGNHENDGERDGQRGRKPGVELVPVLVAALVVKLAREADDKHGGNGAEDEQRKDEPDGDARRGAAASLAAARRRRRGLRLLLGLLWLLGLAALVALLVALVLADLQDGGGLGGRQLGRLLQRRHGRGRLLGLLLMGNGRQRRRMPVCARRRRHVAVIAQMVCHERRQDLPLLRGDHGFLGHELL